MLRQKIIDKLTTVMDPELRKDVWELGLIRDLEVEGTECSLKFRPTATHCPIAIMLAVNIFDALAELEGLEDVNIRVIDYIQAEKADQILQDLRKTLADK